MDVNILLFDGFESLDVFGPVEILSQVNRFSLQYYSFGGGEVKSAQNTSVLTACIGGANREGILIVPGGKGTRTLVKDSLFIKLLADLVQCAAVFTKAFYCKALQKRQASFASAFKHLSLQHFCSVLYYKQTEFD